MTLLRAYSYLNTCVHTTLLRASSTTNSDQGLYVCRMHARSIYSSTDEKEEAVYKQELEEIASENPNFNFKIWPSRELGYLSLDKLGLDDYNKGFLICGPKGLKENMMKQLKAKGVSSQNIYDEEFAFR